MKPEGIKIAVIGGASAYTPELIDGLIRSRSRLPLASLTLMDIYGERLKVVGGMAQRMFDHANYPLTVELTTDRAHALQGADFVVCQIRVGGMTARLNDETIPPRYGVIGQETVGPGGITSALRTIPVMLEIARDVERICPDAWFLNFTNPSGVITETLLTQTRVKAIGLCNIPTDMHLGIAELCFAPFDAVQIDYFGINHLSWIRDVHVNGVSKMDTVLETYIELMNQDDDPLFDARLLETIGMIPSYYLSYYYNRNRMLNEQLHGGKSRAERVFEIEQALLSLYADQATVEKPALLAERGGRHYSTVAVNLIAAIAENSGEQQILNVANGPTFSNFTPDSVIEVACKVDAQGAHPLPAAPIPAHVIGLMQTVKSSEKLTIEAAITGDQQTTLRALMTNPLVPSLAVARSLYAALLAENIDYLPQFEL